MPNTGAQTYVTVDGDMLDAIAHRIYGRNADSVNFILRANPHLRHEPMILPAGLEVSLPELPAESPADQVSLWD